MPDRICVHNCTALRYLFEKIRILIGRDALRWGRWGAGALRGGRTTGTERG